MSDTCLHIEAYMYTYTHIHMYTAYLCMYTSCTHFHMLSDLHIHICTYIYTLYSHMYSQHGYIYKYTYHIDRHVLHRHTHMHTLTLWPSLTHSDGPYVRRSDQLSWIEILEGKWGAAAHQTLWGASMVRSALTDPRSPGHRIHAGQGQRKVPGRERVGGVSPQPGMWLGHEQPASQNQNSQGLHSPHPKQSGCLVRPFHKPLRVPGSLSLTRPL